jgi:outer membrane protein OmpA-like peptidoglycan-associated protein
MRYLILAICGYFLMPTTAAQQVFWASEVLQFSSQYKTKEFGAAQVLGKPNSMTIYGQSLVAWAPALNTKSATITVGFDNAVQVQQIAIGESLRPGSISKIWLYDERGKEYLVYDNPQTKPLPSEEPRMFRHFMQMTPYKVAKLKLQLEYANFRSQPQIDCIGISAVRTPIEPKINIIETKQAVSTPQNLGPNVNSSYPDMLPIITPDGKTLYFARKYAPENFGAEKKDDIYVSELNALGQWTKARNIGAPLNNDAHNFVCAISPDGNTMYLANRYDYRTEGSGVSVAYRKKDGSWSKPAPLDIKNMYNKSKFACYHVSLDGKTMVMAIERDDTFGDMDLYVSFRYADGTWTEPMNMGADVNTAGAEASIFLAADGKTIYFSSKGHAGYGDFDMFMSRRLDNSWKRWSEPVNLGPKINSAGQDIYYTIPASGDYAYFSSDVYGYGQHDIFRITLPTELRPEAVNISAGLYSSNWQEPAAPAIRAYQEPAPTALDERIEQLKRQLQAAQGQPVAEPEVSKMEAQEKALETQIKELESKYETLPGRPEPSTPSAYYAPSTGNFPPVERPVTPYDPKYDQQINEKKRQLEMLKVRAQEPAPRSSGYTPSGQSGSASNTALSAYEEKLRALEQKSKPGAGTTASGTETPGQGSPAAPVKSSPTLSAYEEKLRKLEAAQQQQEERPAAAEPIRIAAQTKPVVEEKAEEHSAKATVKSIPVVAQDITPIYIPDKREAGSTPSEALAEDAESDADVQPKEFDALKAEREKLEEEIRQLMQDKERLSASASEEVGKITGDKEQLLSEKEQLALSIAQMQEEREAIAREKQKLELEKQKLESLRNQQYKDIGALKKELDSLNNLQAAARKKAEESINYSSIDELEAMAKTVGAKVSLKDVFFGANASFLQPKSFAELDKLALYLKKNTDLNIEVGGHTNGLCDDAFCNELSTKRAKTVVDYLISKGVDGARLSYRGYGKTQNIADNNSEEGRKKNQRVEIKITGLGK